MAVDDTGVDVAVVDPTDSYVTEAIGYRLKKAVRLQVALASDLDRAFERLYPDGAGTQAELAKSAGEKVAALRHVDVERLKDLASDAPVIRLVNRWIEEAVERGASDVHIEAAI